MVYRVNILAPNFRLCLQCIIKCLIRIAAKASSLPFFTSCQVATERGSSNQTLISITALLPPVDWVISLLLPRLLCVSNSWITCDPGSFPCYIPVPHGSISTVRLSTGRAGCCEEKSRAASLLRGNSRVHTRRYLCNVPVFGQQFFQKSSHWQGTEISGFYAKHSTHQPIPCGRSTFGIWH